jgi:hypothetical protein
LGERGLPLRYGEARAAVATPAKPEGTVMNDVATVGIDLAKNVFAVHGIDGTGRVVLRRMVSVAKS